MKTMLRTYARGWPTRTPNCCICSKHGLSLAGIPALGSLEWQILKTMLRTYAAEHRRLLGMTSKLL